jgi:hypothetical protein
MERTAQEMAAFLKNAVPVTPEEIARLEIHWEIELLDQDLATAEFHLRQAKPGSGTAYKWQMLMRRLRTRVRALRREHPEEC